VSAREAPPAEAHVEQILGHAAQRGERMGLRYAGAVTPQEAHRLREAGAAAIVDVRTPAEYAQVGHVPETPLIEWPRNGGRAEMRSFLDVLRAKFIPRKVFICPSGVRSLRGGACRACGLRKCVQRARRNRRRVWSGHEWLEGRRPAYFGSARRMKTLFGSSR
jgi:rhodanese-related sulfurtransferase